MQINPEHLPVGHNISNVVKVKMYCFNSNGYMHTESVNALLMINYTMREIIVSARSDGIVFRRIPFKNLRQVLAISPPSLRSRLHDFVYTRFPRLWSFLPRPCNGTGVTVYAVNSTDFFMYFKSTSICQEFMERFDEIIAVEKIRAQLDNLDH